MVHIQIRDKKRLLTITTHFSYSLCQVSENGSVVKDLGSIPAGDCASFFVPWARALSLSSMCSDQHVKYRRSRWFLAISYWITMLNNTSHNKTQGYILLPVFTYLMLPHTQFSSKYSAWRAGHIAVAQVRDIMVTRVGPVTHLPTLWWFGATGYWWIYYSYSTVTV